MRGSLWEISRLCGPLIDDGFCTMNTSFNILVRWGEGQTSESVLLVCLFPAVDLGWLISVCVHQLSAAHPCGLLHALGLSIPRPWTCDSASTQAAHCCARLPPVTCACLELRTATPVREVCAGARDCLSWEVLVGWCVSWCCICPPL